MTRSARRIGRRSFLAAGAAPLLGALAGRRATAATAAEVDVLVVGAGAAGIAAARKLLALGRSFLVLEAGERVGGRCVTDTARFGVPVDLGAHWIHAADRTPFPLFAKAFGMTTREPVQDPTLYEGRRKLAGAEADGFGDAYDALEQAIVQAGEQGLDIPAASVVPRGLGAWGDLVGFLIGPFGCGKDLDRISTLDFARAVEYPELIVREGFGTLLARLAEGIPVGFSTPVRRIDHGGVRIAAETDRGGVSARRVIVTASTDALANGAVRFDPPLPIPQEDALSGLSLGRYLRVCLEFPGNPFRFAADEPVYWRGRDRRTGALLGATGGSDVAYVDFAGSHADELERAGERAAIDAAVGLMAETFGTDALRRLGRSLATGWGRDPFVRGAFSCAEPGRAGDRAVLAEPLDGRIWIAGEATHRSLWGTVGGAWAEGERAAEAASASL